MHGYNVQSQRYPQYSIYPRHCMIADSYGPSICSIAWRLGSYISNKAF